MENAGQIDDRSPYAPMQRKMARFASAMDQKGSDPREVIELISRVLRYPVGKGLKPLLLAIRFFPQRLIDRIVARRM